MTPVSNLSNIQKGHTTAVKSKSNKNTQMPELFILAASRHGQRKAGVELAPQRLLTFCSFEGGEEEVDAELTSVISDEKAALNKKLISTNKVPILRPEAVAKTNLKLHESIFESTMKAVDKGFLPRILTLGGDHSIAIGSVSAVSNILEEVLRLGVNNVKFTRPEPIVFWIDAHADINTPSCTASGNLHGCPVSLLAGIDEQGWRELKVFDWARERLAKVGRDRKSFIQTKRLVYIGLRDVDLPEQELIDSLQIEEYNMKRFKKEGRNIVKIIAESLAKVDPRGEHPIHISFDIDALDPEIAPSTGTPVPDGLSLEEGMQIITELSETGRLVSMDLVEVNPSLGNESDVQSTLQSASKLIERFNNF